MQEPSELYTAQRSGHEAELGRIRERLTGVSFLRLLSFGGLVWAVIQSAHAPSLLAILAAIVCFSAFIFLINYYFRLKDRKLLLEKLVFVNINEGRVLEGQPNQFPDGRELLDSNGYLDDLDVFGQKSLFHTLNRTTTRYGSDTLAGMLKSPLLVPEEIIRRQAAIQALVPQLEGRQLLTAHGLVSGDKEGTLHTMQEWLDTPSRLYGRRWVWVISWAVTIFNLGAIYYALDTGHVILLAAGIVADRLITALYARYIGEQSHLLDRKKAILDQYAAILNQFTRMDRGQSAMLQDLQQRTARASNAIKSLSRLMAWFEQRANMLVATIFNSLFMYDLHCMSALEKWKEANRADFPDWVKVVGEIECLNSIASFACNNPGYGWPQPAETPAPFIEAKGMAHPLIPAAGRVANDFSIGRQQQLMLVTGSNMSGKTTFLRTIGVNLLLAQCGAPVCAEIFSFSSLRLLTSLRISDSLQENTSYFMAELKKLRMIVESLRKDPPALVLIDEILRGTNSEDKTYGSEQFIRKLLQYPCIALFATHDLTLGALENELPGQISNACFESIIEGDQLTFSYRLQQGVARNRNASFLMKKMEII